MKHLDGIRTKVRDAARSAPPAPWKHVSTIAIGGLTAVGFDRDSELLLVVSRQGRDVIDASSGQKVARDATEYYEDDRYLEAEGIGPLSNSRRAVIRCRRLGHRHIEASNERPSNRLSVRQGLPPWVREVHPSCPHQSCLALRIYVGSACNSEQEAMDRMEDLLAPALEKSGFAMLALVSTGENLREWTYYAKSEQEFLQAMNAALAQQARFPLEVQAAPDPQWSTYDRFRRGVRE